LKFTIPSNYDEGWAVLRRIVEDLERGGFTTGSAFAVKIALEEALVNAIKHGNRLDPNKKVHIEARLTPERAEISIEDEGPGFDRGGVPDPTAEENLTKCSGRGILLIEAYMNRASWDRNGRRLTMVRENGPDEIPPR
jgi:serine/threonine-protein kinase RsbW